MASPEQLARFFSALQFDPEDGRAIPVKGTALRPPAPVTHTRPAPVVVHRDPYRPMDPAWFIVGALVLSLVFAAMRLGHL
jgi:hypothetical protein